MGYFGIMTQLTNNPYDLERFLGIPPKIPVVRKTDSFTIASCGLRSKLESVAKIHDGKMGMHVYIAHRIHVWYINHKVQAFQANVGKYKHTWILWVF